MDHTLHTSFDPKSPFSPRARQTIGSKRTLASPVFRKSLRPNTSSRVSASVQIITKTAHNFVERYGQALPVLVTEALTFVERNTVVTARIADNGYAWLICGRRLLVWQYQHLMMLSNVNTPQKKQITQCYELQLPQSDLAHRAELVCVFLNKGSNMPSCLAVSPEGVVRYWPAIAHESLSVEQSVDLQGQECDSLTDVKGLGCILATTTCTVVLVQPQYHAGKYSLNTKMLKPPSGWLGGISKRMSSLIFGPISSESSAETRLVRVLTDQEFEDTWIVYVLAGHSLQKWKLSSNNTEQLIFVAELNRLVKESFFPSTICDQNETDVWLLDIQADKGNLIILAAAMNVHVSPKLFYAMVSIETSTNQPPTSVKDFLLLENAALNRDDGPVERLSYRLLLVGLNAYVYNHKIVVVIKPQEATDTLDFSVMSQDFILAGAICMNTPIFFTRTHGLVSIQNVDKLEQSFATLPHQDASFNESSFQATENLTIYNLDPEDIHNAYKDTVGQFKAAFIHHIKQQEAACRDILERLFALNESKSTSRFGVDPVLDKVVLRTLEDLLDDIPAGDPRWTGDAPIGIGSSYSMQVANQLVDKQRAANLLVKFLHETELWDRLLVCTHRDTPIATVHIIAELLEKAVTATKMKRLTANSPVLEAAIERCIKNAKAELKNGLSHQDLFFKEVTGVHRALQEIVNECDEMAHSEQDPNETVAVISEANDVILEVMKEVIDYREQIAPNFVPSAQARSLSPEYLPWTSAPTSYGLYNFLTTQQLLTYNYGIKISSDKSLVNTLFNQLVGLIDIILDGAKNHLESMRGTDKEPLLLKQFEVQRSKFIKPLLLEEKWERAAALAEKYLDFEALVTICELTGNQPRLDEYADRFQAEGFAEFIYNWYLQQNKYGELISQCRAIRKTRTAQKLSGFFASHPSLSWIQNVFEGRYNGAAKTLRNLAANEQESVMRRKTMLSLAKLAKLASDTHDVEHFVRGVNSQLELIVFQEEIPDYVLERFGYDIRRPRVIPPRDLVKLYISSEYKEASELEFKKALDLLAFIEDEELKEELLFDIWRSSILRDSWNYPVVDSPMDTLQHTLFFKLLDLALVLDVQCQISLPPLEALLEDESMESLRSNHNFIVLLKTAYEYAQRTQT